MLTKPVIALFLVFITVLFLVVTRNVETNEPSDVLIETIGLDDSGIRLEAPYGSKSLRHVLLINDSPHNLLACDVEFELITNDGRSSPARKIVAFAYLLQASPDVRQKLLKTSPGITPHSKMLLGLGVEPDQVRITDTLPPLGTSGVDVTLKKSVTIDKVIIRLNAVVLENGQAIGPKGAEFLVHLKDSVLKENTNEK